MSAGEEKMIPSARDKRRALAVLQRRGREGVGGVRANKVLENHMLLEMLHSSDT